MKICQKILLTAAVLGAAAVVAATQHEEEAAGCAIDQPGLTEGDRYNIIKEKALPCFTGHLDMDKLNALRDLPGLDAYREVFRGMCSHSQEIATCLAGMRNSIANCKVKNESDAFILFSGLVEHVFVSGCEQGGENLALLFRGAVLLVKRPEGLSPLKRCLIKSYPSLSIAEDDEEINLASQTYILYQETEMAKRCIQYVDDEAYRSAAQWLHDVLHTGIKCKLPDAEGFAPCSEVDPSKVTTFCQVRSLQKENLFDFLEDIAMKRCVEDLFSFDRSDPANSKDLSWLKSTYHEACDRHRTMPECLVMISSLGEQCLPAGEGNQFGLEMQFLEDYVNRLCVEDGAFLARVMHEVYGNVPEHGHAFRDCVEEAAKAEGHSDNKGRRFYEGVVAYKKCVRGKLHESNEMAAGLETAIDDTLKKMKCVNPEDGGVVLCETLYQEH